MPTFQACLGVCKGSHIDGAPCNRCGTEWQRTQPTRAIVASAELPAITIRIIHHSVRAVPTIAVVTTIPRADPLTWAIAHEIAARLCREHVAQPLADTGMPPTIEVGRHNSCVTVTVACKHAQIARTVLHLIDGYAHAQAGARSAQPTHRVVSVTTGDPP